MRREPPLDAQPPSSIFDNENPRQVSRGNGLLIILLGIMFLVVGPLMAESVLEMAMSAIVGTFGIIFGGYLFHRGKSG